MTDPTIRVEITADHHWSEAGFECAPPITGAGAAMMRITRPDVTRFGSRRSELEAQGKLGKAV